MSDESVFLGAPTDMVQAVDLPCPDCGHVELRQIATGLPLSQAPWLREAILEGRLHAFRCGACGVGFRVESIFSYLDLRRRTLLYVLPEDALDDLPAALDLAEQSFRETMVERCPPMVRAWGETLTRRVVFGLASAREKLIALDAGLDDRRLEGAKLAVMRAYGVPLELPLFLDRVTPAGLVCMQRTAHEMPVELLIEPAVWQAAEPWGTPGDIAVDLRLDAAIWRDMPPPPIVETE